MYDIEVNVRLNGYHRLLCEGTGGQCHTEHFTPCVPDGHKKHDPKEITLTIPFENVDQDF